jgi:hypothetical protein
MDISSSGGWGSRGCLINAVLDWHGKLIVKGQRRTHMPTYPDIAAHPRLSIHPRDHPPVPSPWLAVYRAMRTAHGWTRNDTLKYGEIPPLDRKFGDAGHLGLQH